MRVALYSYPTALPGFGGLEVQIRETMAGLRGCGIDATIFDWREEKLADFDLIHVFSAINGNYRMVEAARAAGVRIVVSTVLHPPFTARDRRWAMLAESLVGRLTDWNHHTSFSELVRCLRGADHLIALGEVERDMLIKGYELDQSRITVVPNGIAKSFFEADPNLFIERFQLASSFAVCVGSVEPRKNQLTVVRAVREIGMHAVLIGAPEHRDYLDQCLELGGSDVSYLGFFPYGDPILASAYAAAEVSVLPSKSEVLPLSVIESLAAGTPAVVTKFQSLDIAAQPGVLEYVDPEDTRGIAEAMKRCKGVRWPRRGCADLVASYSWNSVAIELSRVYERVLAERH